MQSATGYLTRDFEIKRDEISFPWPEILMPLPLDDYFANCARKVRFQSGIAMVMQTYSIVTIDFAF
jgi:hypothetical protein